VKLGRAARWLFTPPPADKLPRRLSQLFVGLVLYGVSDALLVLGGLGLDPWDVLHQGLSAGPGSRSEPGRSSWARRSC
jgi:uncharacterized membrane protein YczE